MGEPVLVMRRFPAQALLAWQMAHGEIGAALAASSPRMAAAARMPARRRRDATGADIMTGLGAQLSKAFIDSPDIFRPAETLEFHALYEAALDSQPRHCSNERGDRGLVRRCHGDMHCGNIIVEEGEPKLFDAIEFSEKIATIDVLYDLAFLLMDLWTHGEKAAANIVLNRYLHLRRAEEDLSGLALLPLFLATRAGVRALVTADLAHELALKNSMKERGQALDWFRASIDYLKVAAARAALHRRAVGHRQVDRRRGASRPHLGAAPGALHVRSDVERKVLAGVAETERLPPESYSREASFAVYAACLARAGACAGGGPFRGARCRLRAARASAAPLPNWPAAAGAHFAGVWLEAPPEVLTARVAARRGDASDATAEVVAKQLALRPGPDRLAARRCLRNAGGDAGPRQRNASVSRPPAQHEAVGDELQRRAVDMRPARLAAAPRNARRSSSYSSDGAAVVSLPPT